MRIISLFIATLCLAACPQVKQAPPRTVQDGPGSAAKPVVSSQTLAVVFSATESDAWVKEVTSLIGGRLEIDPWADYEQRGHLDVYGPYAGALDEQALQVVFAMTNLVSVPGMEGQEAVAAEVLAWLDELEPDVIWLDGDVAQFQVGRKLDRSQSRVFTGVVLNKDFYYDAGEKVTGVHKWHSITIALKEIWRADLDAKIYTLLSDDSPYSAAIMRRFAEIQGFMPPGMEFTVQPTAHNWDEVADVIGNLDPSVDALIICGMGNEGCSAALLEQDCPADILQELEIPVVALGPTRMDHTGLKSLKIKTAVHVEAAMERVGKILQGVDPRSLKVETPDDMSIFSTELDDGKPVS